MIVELENCLGKRGFIFTSPIPTRLNTLSPPTKRTKKPQISRPEAFSFHIWCPAPFEPGGEVPAPKGFSRVCLSKGYTWGYTAPAAGVFSVGFSLAEKAVEVRCSTPDERYRHRDKPPQAQRYGHHHHSFNGSVQKWPDHLVPHF